MSNSNSNAGTKADSSKKAETTSVRQTIAKPRVMGSFSEIKIVVYNTKRETPYMVDVYIDEKWFKEMGPFSDPQLALQEVSKNEDLQQFMRPV